LTKADRVMAAFREFSARNTQQREIIADRLVALGEAGEAFSAETLLTDLRLISPSIGRATVFRTIDKLVQLKVLDRIDFAGGERCYRLCDKEQHHHHLTCRICHRVVELELCLPSAKIEAIGQREHFTIEDHEISLYGLCEKCGKKTGFKKR
jgi:Fur family transcriptional regulator, ferric uptake regulator